MLNWFTSHSGDSYENVTINYEVTNESNTSIYNIITNAPELD